MPRSENKTTPVIINGILYTDDDANGTHVDTHDWFMWLYERLETFSFNTVTFRVELRRNLPYWYGYKKIDGKKHKKYAGRSVGMNLARLNDVAAALHRETLSDQ